MPVMALGSVDNSALLAVSIPLGMAPKGQDLTGHCLGSDWLWSGWPPEIPQVTLVTPVELGGGCGCSGDTGSVSLPSPYMTEGCSWACGCFSLPCPLTPSPWGLLRLELHGLANPAILWSL